MLLMLGSPATEGTILLAGIALALLIEGAHKSAKKALETQSTMILKRLDKTDGMIDEALRRIEKLDARLPNEPRTKVADSDENEEILKGGWLATRAQHRRRDKALRERRLSGEKALTVHGDLIAHAKRLCEKEGLKCDEFGCPEPYKTWMHDNSPTSKAKFDAAKRVAEAYRPILLDALRNAIGDALMAKLGEPERYVYPQSGPGHEEVLAYCNIEFKHVDKSVFDGLPLPANSELDGRNEGIIPHDRNIEVSHTAGFGIFDPGFGEQYLPGDLRIVVGVKTVTEVTSFYAAWRYQVNPTASNFLDPRLLVELRSDPNGSSAESGASV